MRKRRGCQQKDKYGKYKFKYIPDWDAYICPERDYLEYVTTDRNGYREYKCKNDRCANCPRREECLSEKQKAFAVMCGKIIGMRYMYSHILTRVRKYTQNKKRKSSVALQNQKNCMVCAIAACSETKEFPNNACLLQRYRI